MRKEFLRGLTSVSAFGLVLAVFGTNIAMANAGTINSYLGIAVSKIETPDTGEDTEYYKSDYGELSDENLEKLLLDSYEQCVNEQAEGSVLLRNENNALPLSSEERSGNALDNAIEAVMELEDIQKRVISVKIVAQQDILVIQIQNYYDRNLIYEDGLPVTTKKNRYEHGYGMKSIRYMAEKYNGTITVSSEDDIFRLQILIPAV